MRDCQLAFSFVLFATIVLQLVTVNTLQAKGQATNGAGKCQFNEASSHTKTDLKRIAPLIGKSFTLTTEDNKCYSVGVCGPAKNSPSDGEQSVVEYEGHCESQQKRVLGRLSSCSLQGVDDNSVILSYGNGDKIDANVSALSAQVIVVCADKEELTRVRSEGQNVFIFKLRSPKVCLESSGGLGAGWTFVIIFVVAVGLYLIIGISYRRFKVGAVGIDQLPHAEIWKKLGSLAADGCDFCFRRGSLTRPGYNFDTTHDDSMIQP